MVLSHQQLVPRGGAAGQPHGLCGHVSGSVPLPHDQPPHWQARAGDRPSPRGTFHAVTLYSSHGAVAREF